MSDLSAIMDALVTVAETVSGVTAERVLRYADEVGAENFPFCCIYDPDEEAELGDWQLTTKKTTVSVLLFTKGETQNALLTKMDAFRDAIVADRTLGGIVQFAHVASRAISEDNRPSETEPMRAALMTVETTEATGRIFHLTIEMEFLLTVGYTDYDSIVNLWRLDIEGHLPNWGTQAADDWILDREAIPVNQALFQLRVVFAEIMETAAANQWRTEVAIEFYYHMGPGIDEQDVIEKTIWPALDGLINPGNWRAHANIHQIIEPPRITLSEVTREG